MSTSPIVLHLGGLTVDVLGYDRFRRVYHCVRLAAEHYAPGRYRLAADYQDHVRVGYVVDLPDRVTAEQVLNAYHVALADNRMPWVSP